MLVLTCYDANLTDSCRQGYRLEERITPWEEMAIVSSTILLHSTLIILCFAVLRYGWAFAALLILTFTTPDVTFGTCRTAFHPLCSREAKHKIELLETVLKGRDLCCICCQRIGLCIKCNYGNCQSTFHPSYARNAGYYMYVRTSGGKLLHKAYCDRHSMEQKEKAETQQHGPEELKAVKQIQIRYKQYSLVNLRWERLMDE
ncbi:Phd finger family protein [Thalictrum thalictroides]|uniref:Phd finger family protein n=1 Tax=Thalictrum thalictroides TaxID=46969 RepID=A0A7J6WG19_THATH|nr:Phd finger family protein [Thalictrum thalictroides]